MTDIIHIQSISQLYHLMEIEKPVHPLISVVRHTTSMKLNFGGIRFNSDLYFISLKENIESLFDRIEKIREILV